MSINGDDESAAYQALIKRYAAASAADDFETMESLRHADWQTRMPQSGEAIVSSADYREFRTRRPEGAPRVEHIAEGGSGSSWWSEAVVHYADGTEWLMITVLALKDGLIHRERAYFGPPVAAPEWRRPWVTLETPAIR